jgi:hypothetical protein
MRRLHRLRGTGVAPLLQSDQQTRDQDGPEELKGKTTRGNNSGMNVLRREKRHAQCT